jgi:MORN repeat
MMNTTIIHIATSLAVACAAAIAPARAGDWSTDLGFGCRVWNPNPQPDETVRWAGTCANGFAHGHGAAQWFKNNLPFETDEGEWQQGRQVGHGSQAWPSGHYEGDLVDGEPHGHSVLLLQKVRYEGEFRNGKPNGVGTLTNGTDIIHGTWTNGCLRDATRKISFGVPLSTCR